jgi:internalin A
MRKASLIVVTVVGVGAGWLSGCSRSLGGGGLDGGGPRPECQIVDPTLAAAARSGGTYVGATNVGSLEGIQCLEELTALSVHLRAGGVDLTPLAGHPRLEDVQLENVAGELTPLATIPHLARVSLSGAVNDLAPFAGSTTLEQLFVDSPNLASLAGLSRTPRLKTLGFHGAVLTSLQGMPAQPALEILDLRDTRLGSLRGLDAAPNLAQLSVTASGLTSFEGLANVSKLKLINVSSSPVATLDGIGAATALETLIAHETRLTSLAPLAGARALTNLNVSGTRVSDLAPLRDLPNLRALVASATLVSDLSPLAGHAQLTDVEVSWTKVSSLAPVSGSQISRILAHGAALASLDGLHDVPRLRQLRLTANNIADVAPVTGLGPMWLDLTDNPLGDDDISVLQSLCAQGWAASWTGGGCGDACRFESCTLQ